MLNRFALMFALSAFLLGGCAETEFMSHWWKKGTGSTSTTTSAPTQQGNFKIGTPYQISGKWYTPNESYSYDETGISSWYGDQFHGKRTANGEVFNKNELTAAHPTLQLPSLIRVTNLENGRSAVLRVNDRGPFSKSRLIDVSHQSARVLGFESQGTARVRVQVLEAESRILADAARQGYAPHVQMAMAFRRPADITAADQSIQVASLGRTVSNPPVTSHDLPPPTAAQANVTDADIDDLNKQLFRKVPVSPTNMYIQVGSFSDRNNAETLRNKIAHLGNAAIYQTTINGQVFNRVRLGPIGSVPQADAMLNKTIKAGHSSARIIVD